ncbi:MAG: glycine--tRNA ligase [Methanobacterium sp.]|uniref:glycine--tRNA ligase n=1 Tax=Methanobacterium sp. TaxID=2164 RepID=UPI003D65AC28|nr:glycine--tRNA ligase [Methanobacterium sp.]
MKHDKVMNVAKKRGFLWSSFEIYAGVAGFYDYGPLGAILKNSIIQKWRKYYIVGEGFYEIESPTVMPEEALKASGHVDHFTDPMTECKDCLEVYRADHIIEEVINRDVESLSNEKLTEIISNEKIACPKCGGHLSHVWNYNLMFQTLIGAKGKKTGYMRPETAQGIFIQFKRLLRFFRGKLPFGVVQIGKAYRNEISPRQGVIRLREFTQAEAEIFVDPKDKTHAKFPEIKDKMLKLYPAEIQMAEGDSIEISALDALAEGLVSSEILIYQLYIASKFLKEIGIPDEVIRFRQHLPAEMAHYAIDCWDVEVYTERYGWVEIIGIADRTDFDLKSHSKHSKEELSVFVEYDEPKQIKKLALKPNMGKFGPSFKGDAPKILKELENIQLKTVKDTIENEGAFKLQIEDKSFELLPEHVSFEEVEETVRGKKIFPHVIEPSYGIDRIIFSVLLHTFTEDKENEREYFKLPKDIAPVEVNVFPLLNKEELRNIAIQIKDNLRKEGLIAEFDASGTIGRRYARSDEIGVPFAITVDHESLEDKKVTIRNRDDLKQKRVPISNISTILDDLMNYRVEFEDIK